MSEEQRFGDGQDNYLQGMRQAAEAARQFGSAAGGAGARRVGQALPETALHGGGTQAQLLVQPADQGLVRALLRGKDMGRASRAIQGVVDVAHGDQLHLGKGGEPAVQLYAADAGEVAADGDEAGACLVQKAHA